MKKIFWNAEAEPIGTTLARILYEIRAEDGDNPVLLDSLSVDDILEDSEGLVSFDALTAPYAKLERKMELMRKYLEQAVAEGLRPITMEIVGPFRKSGLVNVVCVYTLGDGQTVSIFFDNPDITPTKINPTDILISWKWLLNKKDVSILVAPEHGEELNAREVVRRIAKLAEKNMTAFARQNAKKAEREANIKKQEEEIAAVEAEIKELRKTVERLEAEIEAETERNADLKKQVEAVRERRKAEAEKQRQEEELRKAQEAAAEEQRKAEEAARKAEAEAKQNLKRGADTPTVVEPKGGTELLEEGPLGIKYYPKDLAKAKRVKGVASDFSRKKSEQEIMARVMEGHQDGVNIPNTPGLLDLLQEWIQAGNRTLMYSHLAEFGDPAHSEFYRKHETEESIRYNEKRKEFEAAYEAAKAAKAAKAAEPNPEEPEDEEDPAAPLDSEDTTFRRDPESQGEEYFHYVERPADGDEYVVRKVVDGSNVNVYVQVERAGGALMAMPEGEDGFVGTYNKRTSNAEILRRAAKTANKILLAMKFARQHEEIELVKGGFVETHTNEYARTFEKKIVIDEYDSFKIHARLDEKTSEKGTFWVRIQDPVFDGHPSGDSVPLPGSFPKDVTAAEVEAAARKAYEELREKVFAERPGNDPDKKRLEEIAAGNFDVNANGFLDEFEQILLRIDGKRPDLEELANKASDRITEALENAAK